MVTVKVFGTIRLDTGIKEMKADVGDVKSLYPLLLKQAKQNRPAANVTAADFGGCLVFVNGVQAKKSTKLQDGDSVMLMSPVSGG